MDLDMSALGAAVDAAFAQVDLTAWWEMEAWRLWGGRTAAELIAEYGEPGPSMNVQICNGMGIDSAAIITRLIEDPDARVLLITDADGTERLIRVDLADVTVVSSMTGNEFDETRAAMQDFLLPLMQAAGLRYVQVCRAGQSQQAGIVVLDDTAAHTDGRPWQMHMRGPWALSDELVAAGTVPQTAAGQRRCSYRAKGWVLDTWATQEYGGGERVHVIGFAAEEGNRVAKDQSYSHATRRSVYPLRQWGWNREHCERYLLDRFGIIWPRSCCVYCPFAGGSKRKNALLAERWRCEPAAGILTLTLETVALGLNPRMALFNTSTARAVAEQQGLTETLAAVDGYLEGCPWAIYDVQRVVRPHGAKKGTEGDPTRKGKTWRRTTTVRTGTRHEMTAALASARDGRHEPGRTPRLWLVEAQPTYPTCERLLVAAPAGVDDKEEKGFADLWATTIAEQGSAGQLTKHRVPASRRGTPAPFLLRPDPEGTDHERHRLDPRAVSAARRHPELVRPQQTPALSTGPATRDDRR